MRQVRDTRDARGGKISFGVRPLRFTANPHCREAGGLGGGDVENGVVAGEPGPVAAGPDRAQRCVKDPRVGLSEARLAGNDDGGQVPFNPELLNLRPLSGRGPVGHDADPRASPGEPLQRHMQRRRRPGASGEGRAPKRLQHAAGRYIRPRQPLLKQCEKLAPRTAAISVGGQEQGRETRPVTRATIRAAWVEVNSSMKGEQIVREAALKLGGEGENALAAIGQSTIQIQQDGIGRGHGGIISPPAWPYKSA